MDSTDTEQRFIITDNRADTTTLSVTVQNSSTDTFTTTFTKATDISQLSVNSNVFFLQEIENERYEIMFGDGVFGKKIEEPNFVEVSYIVSNGSEAKVVDDTDYISRPNSFSTIDLQVQYELDEGMYFSGDLRKIDTKYGDYGIATEDEVKANTRAENDIKLGINVVF